MYASKLNANRLVRALSAAGLALALGITSAHAGNDREAEQLKRLKLQLRQVQQDQAAAQAAAQAQAAADKAAMEASVKAAKNEAGATKAAVGAATRKAQALSTELQAVKDERAQLTEQVAALQKQLALAQAKASQEAADSQNALIDQKARFQVLAQENRQCRADNATLVDLGKDLLNRYENKGLGAVLASNEPLLQIGRVKLENLAETYRDKLDAAKLKPVAAGTDPAARP
jgi:chromosome segregation ATPase